MNKKELSFYIMADMMMNRGKFSWSFFDRIKHLVWPDFIMEYLKSMRYCCYFSENQAPFYSLPLRLYHSIRYRKLGMKLGFSIGFESLGYGAVIPHYGTIVVGSSNRIGNYAVLHTSTCISDNGKIIGDALYLSTGAKMTRKLRLGDNVSVASNSVVNNDFIEGNCLLTGMPAIKKREAVAWYVRDGESYKRKVESVELLKRKMDI